LYDIQPELVMDKKFWVHEVNPDTGKPQKRMRIRHSKSNLDSITLERKLNAQVEKMISVVDEQIRKGNAPSHQTLLKLWSGGEARTLSEFITWRISEDSVNVATTTVKRWKLMLRHINGFDKEVLLQEVDVEWLLRYEKYLRHEIPRVLGGKSQWTQNNATGYGLGQNTIVKEFEMMSRFFRYATLNDFIQKNPFPLFYADRATRKRMNHQKTEYNVLEGAEIDRLHKAYLEEELIEMFKNEKAHLQKRGLRYHHVLQQILVSIYTGFRFGDFKKFGKGEEVLVQNGRITITMQKVNRRQTIKLTDRLWEVLSLEKEGKLLSGKVYSNSCSNQHLRIVLSLLGFTKHYTWHDLRRTFASYLQEKNVDIHKVSKLMGHSSVTVTERYVKVRNQDLDTAMDVWDEKPETDPNPSPDDNANAADSVTLGLLELVRANPGIELPEKLQDLVAGYLPDLGSEKTDTKSSIRIVG
jgi:integrase